MAPREPGRRAPSRAAPSEQHGLARGTACAAGLSVLDCGRMSTWVAEFGEGATPDRVGRALAAVPHRGDRRHVATLSPGTPALRQEQPAVHGVYGLRWWGREAGAAGEGEAGTLGLLEGDVVLAGEAFGATGRLSPGRALAALQSALNSKDPVTALDGGFALLTRDAETGEVLLATDPFGHQRVYWHAPTSFTLRAATDLGALRAFPGFTSTLSLPAVDAYLTFGCVPGPETLLADIWQLPPGHVLRWRPGTAPEVTAWFRLQEALLPTTLEDALARLAALSAAAVARRRDASPAALYLSGGLDSSSVGAWLKASGSPCVALTLDFGAPRSEREEALTVARHLGLPCEVVPACAKRLAATLDVWLGALDSPIGEAVLGPHWLLGEAARARGLQVAWNGEGGDQLFGGWTAKPMIAATVYGASHEAPDEIGPEEQYLRSYHKFHGLEGELHGPALAAAGTPEARSRRLAPYLGGGDAQTFLSRVRFADLHLKGACNILPRAERMAASHGVTLRMPLFDRALAAWSFTLPSALKLEGATEKVLLKRAMAPHLPEAIVWRRKAGMGVPITDWLLGPLRKRMKDLLSDKAVKRRGLFSLPFVRALREGHDVASETRRRRLGERLWALMVLEHWCRRTLD
jgi:asparagine synthase (glutamine-hydrolysing)